VYKRFVPTERSGERPTSGPPERATSSGSSDGQVPAVRIEPLSVEDGLSTFPAEERDRTIRTADARRLAAGVGVFAAGVVVGAFLMYALTVEPESPDMRAELSPPAETVDAPAARSVPNPQPPAPPASAPAQYRSQPESGPVSPVIPSPAAPPARAPGDDDPIERVTFRGALQIRSLPAGARVFINGTAAGVTPLLLPNERIGSRAVRLELDGYDTWTGLVRVVANQRTVTSAVLRPK
jgi:hypothetical protein